MTLPDKLIAIHRSLADKELPHAFGGAIALAYWTLDPRGTSDLDVNIFVPVDRCREALAALPEGVARGEDDVAAIERNGQRRLRWEGTPVDVFFDYLPLHAEAEANVRLVPFEKVEIPILGPVELAVFKAMFDRTKDWADIEAMIAAETLDVGSVRTRIAELAGGRDGRLDRLDAAIRAARPDS